MVKELWDDKHKPSPQTVTTLNGGWVPCVSFPNPEKASFASSSLFLEGTSIHTFGNLDWVHLSSHPFVASPFSELAVSVFAGHVAVENSSSFFGLPLAVVVAGSSTIIVTGECFSSAPVMEQRVFAHNKRHNYFTVLCFERKWFHFDKHDISFPSQRFLPNSHRNNNAHMARIRCFSYLSCIYRIIN